MKIKNVVVICLLVFGSANVYAKGGVAAIGAAGRAAAAPRISLPPSNAPKKANTTAVTPAPYVGSHDKARCSEGKDSKERC